LTFEERKILFEQRARALVGESIVGVRYFEIDYGVPGWEWEHLHSVDFCVEWKMESNCVFCVIWDAEFYQYGLSVNERPCENELHDPTVWDVVSDSNWVSLLHRKIRGVEVYWSYFENLEDGSRYYYPQGMEITFERDDKIFLSAAEIHPDTGELWAEGTDNMVVIFSDDVARRYCLGPYAPEQ